jgi:SHS2 domain-containing protein
MSPYQEVEHTADWALRVWAPTLEGLFADAARGMYALLGAPPEAPGGGDWRAVAVAGEDAEALLVAWLQELLYATEADGVAFDDFQVEALEPTALRGRAHAVPAGRPEKVIKAATYHNLAIRRVDGGYETTIVFDV